MPGALFACCWRQAPPPRRSSCSTTPRWEQVHDLQQRAARRMMRESRVRGRPPELEPDDEVVSFVRYWDEDDLSRPAPSSRPEPWRGPPTPLSTTTPPSRPLARHLGVGWHTADRTPSRQNSTRWSRPSGRTTCRGGRRVNIPPTGDPRPCKHLDPYAGRERVFVSADGEPPGGPRRARTSFGHDDAPASTGQRSTTCVVPTAHRLPGLDVGCGVVLSAGD
jgi:hypothetical protein